MIKDIVVSLNASIIIDAIFVIVVLALGLILAKKLGEFIQKLFEKTRIDQATKNLGWHTFFERYKTRLSISKFMALIFQVYILLITVMISVEILGLINLSKFFLGIIEYYPNIFISAIIFLIAVFIAEFSQKIVYTEADLKYTNALGVLISSTTWLLAILVILYQLKIVPELIMTLFTGVTLALALSFGIAFGLGGQDLAKRLLKKIEKKIK